MVSSYDDFITDFKLGCGLGARLAVVLFQSSEHQRPPPSLSVVMSALLLPSCSVLIDREGRLRIADFGFSRKFELERNHRSIFQSQAVTRVSAICLQPFEVLHQLEVRAKQVAWNSAHTLALRQLPRKCGE